MPQEAPGLDLDALKRTLRRRVGVSLPSVGRVAPDTTLQEEGDPEEKGLDLTALKESVARRLPGEGFTPSQLPDVEQRVVQAEEPLPVPQGGRELTEADLQQMAGLQPIEDVRRDPGEPKPSRLGLRAEMAARGLATAPGQMTEGLGAQIQAIAAGSEKPTGGRLGLGLREAQRQHDLDLGVSEPTTDAPLELLQKPGEAVEEVGRESREFFEPEGGPPGPDEPGFYPYTISQGAGQILSQLALARMGGGGLPSQVARFTLPSATLEGGQHFIETRDRLIEEGVEPLEAARRAADETGAVSIASAMTEAVPGVAALRRLEDAGGPMARAVARALQTGGAEALQEPTQGTISDVASYAGGDERALEDFAERRLIEAKVGGAAGLLGGGGIEVATQASEGAQPAVEDDGADDLPALSTSELLDLSQGAVEAGDETLVQQAEEEIQRRAAGLRGPETETDPEGELPAVASGAVPQGARRLSEIPVDRDAPERIVGAATKLYGEEDPFVAQTHFEAVGRARQEGIEVEGEGAGAYGTPEQHGFATSHGRFVGREEALEIAEGTGDLRRSSLEGELDARDLSEQRQTPDLEDRAAQALPAGDQAEDPFPGMSPADLEAEGRTEDADRKRDYLEGKIDVAFGGGEEPTGRLRGPEDDEAELSARGESLVEVSEDDLDRERLERAYAAVSQRPSTRADIIQREYVEAVEGLEEELRDLATTDEAREVAARELERFRDNYLEKIRAKVDADSRTANPMVTGPASFPSSRNRKRMDVAQKRTREFVDWQKRARRSARESVEEAARGPRDLEAELEEARAFHETMKEANKFIRKDDLSEEAKREQLLQLDLKESSVDQILEGDFAGRKGFPPYILKKNRKNMRRLEEEIEKQGRERAERDFLMAGGVSGTLIENPDADRLQLRFSEKPPAEIRDQLKSSGFRWAPSEGVWQRKLTGNAIAAAEEIVGPAVEGEVTAQEAGEPTGRLRGAEEPVERTGAEDGPAVRLSGNERGMLVERARELHPERFEAYRSQLLERAPEFGFDPDAARQHVEGIEEDDQTPELVRVIDRGVEIPGELRGGETTILTAEGEELPAHYAIIPSDAAPTSHSATTFQEREDSPAARYQDRRYHADPAAQETASERAQSLDPRRLLDPSADPTVGPPIVDPVEDPGRASELMAQFNEPLTKARDPLGDAATRARRLVEEGGDALEHFAETIEPDETIRSYLSTASGREFVQELVADGVIPRQEAGRFIDRRTGMMNDEGRTLVERTMLAAAVRDPDVVDRAPKSWLRQVEKAIPAIVRASRVDGWDVAPVLREALDLGAVAQSEGLTVRDVAAQTDLTGRQWSSEAETVARFLEENGPLATAKAFREYAQDAVGSQNLELFGNVPRTPRTSLMVRFGGEDPRQGRQGRLRGPGAGDVTPGLIKGPSTEPAGPLSVLRRLRDLFSEGAEPEVPSLMTEEEARARPEPRSGADVSFRREEPEERFRAAKEGVGRATLIERVQEALSEAKKYSRRKFRHLPAGGRFEPARFELLRLEKQWDLATERTVRDRLEPILEGLSPEDYDLFTRKVILDDLQHETETNRLPYGFESMEEVQKELERVNDRVENNPAVQGAVERRQQVWDDLKADYIEAMEAIGFDAAQRLTREDYFHHQILHYAKLKRQATKEMGKLRGPKRLRTPTYRGFLRQREGSELDINANYLEAEPEVMAMMDYDTQVARTLKKIRDIYDSGPGLRADLQAVRNGQTDLFEKYEIPEGTDPSTVTVGDLAPEGHVEWHPKPGGTFFLAYSIPERVAMKVFEGVSEEIGLTDDMVRQVVAKGSDQPMIIPEELARTLDDLPGGPASNLAADMSRRGHSAWKQLQLISPRRFGRYNIRNLTGDAEAVFLGNRSAFKKAPEAGVELYQVMFNDAHMSEDFRAWYERGGMQTLLQVQEMGQIKELEQFVRFHEQNPDRPGVIRRAWNKYWRGARRSTDWREAIMRYAAFLDYKEQMEADPEGRPDSFGGSIPEEAMALEDLEDRAFKLSNELVGAYDQISVVGEILRQHIYPFWSFQEINARRYWRFFKNAARDDSLAAEVGKAVLTKTPTVSFSLAVRVGKFALLSSAFYALLSAWNHLLFPEEEEALDPDVQGRPHIVLGRDDETGEVIAFTRLGIFGDLLEWFTPDDLPYQVEDWAKGRRTFTEVAFDMLVKAPINKLAGGLGPVYNYPYTLLSGKELWPDALDGRPVRDKAEWVARSLALADEYKAVTGKPSRPYGESWDDLLTYRYDPREQSYWRIRDRVREFREDLGDAGGGVFMSPRSNALWNLKRALRYEDDTAYRKYLLEYYHLGGTEEGLEQSLESLHPLSRLSDEEENRFRSTYLEAADKKRLQQAIEYYQDLLEGTPISEDRPGSGGPRRRLRVPRRRAPRRRRLQAFRR